METVTIDHKLITSPHQYTGDGLHLEGEKHYVVTNCIVDLSECDLDDIDEAVAITYGASAEFEHCIFRGAGKLVLCGSGDIESDDHAQREQARKEIGKTVTFRECVFSDFSRRGPEVQDGMIVKLDSCLIENWGDPDRFDVRGFGAWVHGEGSRLEITNTVFFQPHFWTGFSNFVTDLANHVGQAVNDSGWPALATLDAWMPGRMRGATATAGGSIYCLGCHTNHSWIHLQNHVAPMSDANVHKMLISLGEMETTLFRELGVF